MFPTKNTQINAMPVYRDWIKKPMTKIKKNQNQIHSCSSLNCCKKSHTKFHRIFVHGGVECLSSSPTKPWPKEGLLQNPALHNGTHISSPSPTPPPPAPIPTSTAPPILLRSCRPTPVAPAPTFCGGDGGGRRRGAWRRRQGCRGGRRVTSSRRRRSRRIGVAAASCYHPAFPRRPEKSWRFPTVMRFLERERGGKNYLSEWKGFCF